MKSKERLVLLADKLDRKGLLREASVIDEVIIKKSFDEETRGDVNSVLNMTLQLLDELDSAVRVGVAGLESEPGSGVFIKGFSGAIKGESLKAYYQDKIQRLREATEHVQELTMLTSEDEIPGDDGPAPQEDPHLHGGRDDEGRPEGGEPDTPWWKFWENSGDKEGDSSGPDERPDLNPEDDNDGIIGMPDPGPLDPEDENDDVEEYEEDDSEMGGSVRRTKFPGVSVEQSISNVGNVTIGE